MVGQGLALLSLDGGGVRGLSSLYILKDLLERIAEEKGLSEIPKPCDYFDMIGGTSTGGLIAIMLGHLRLSVDDCISAYLKISRSVFTRIRRFPISVGVRNKSGELRGTFDSLMLEKAVKDTLKEHDFDEEALLYDRNVSPGCKVFVCALQSEITTPVLFRNFKGKRMMDSDRLKYTKVWQAARATSAASGFFDPLVIRMGENPGYNETYTDGATGCNNPVRQLWNEACDMFLGEQERLEDHLDCIISIGTGKPSIEAFGSHFLEVAKALVRISTETDNTAGDFQWQHRALGDQGRYCRLTVDNGLQDVGLEEYEKADRIIAATKAYLNLPDTIAKLMKCTKTMREHQCESNFA
ncbi:FabD/lysophospholipase-like protein [Aspergillus californicus]